ncbi:hypothetical protein A2767_06045 [Candidatus Roizmanbacteria bacterium RIFCSPHIGHO2_01_FULL_35_10]|uniref:Uncharacterized protein n=1 Tax=Candidatus Roizmanbacteria bacterium RIFCSPLOWO2_01_FULL_35_13 TaxID=1802055 RepID=A0A1F7IHW2_9BACT|nr:MAG: hypothetical protein A2767_06045 [Candidatus Roizmanbacteria bacterium RIFCSPHIGHO2_01_FULL_35_10]OGK42966.1 MAG: hypothetical protein A3A74_05865 [Candidatus Roizmanbacteria bacterium RIFCSPLOWO2_01_FULL_35_13]
MNFTEKLSDANSTKEIILIVGSLVGLVGSLIGLAWAWRKNFSKPKPSEDTREKYLKRMSKFKDN